MKMFFSKVEDEIRSLIAFVSRARWMMAAFAVIVLLNSLNNLYTADVTAREVVISEKDSEIASLQDQIAEYYIPQEEQYRDSLTRIAEYITKTDSFLNVGGQGDTPEYFDPIIYDSIMNGEQDFGGMLTDLDYFFDERAQYFDEIPSIWPLHYSRLMAITSPEGPRFSPFTGNLRDHFGADMTSVWRAEILATAPGKVVEHWIYHEVFGKYIVLQHGTRYRTHYAHLSESYVHEGDIVERGDVMARMGDTGASKGMHLHYAIQEWNEETQEWEWKDPVEFLKRAIGDEKAPEGEVMREVVAELP